MSGDLSYRLIVDMEARGSLAPHLEKVGKAGGELSKVRDVMGSLSSSMGGVAGAFTSAVEGAASVATGIAKIGAVAAGGAIAYGVVGLNNELEQTKISLGAIFNAQLGGGMTKNLGLAKDTLADMRKDAAMLPGEFKDLLGFMRLGSTPGLQAGASIGQLEKLSAAAMAASAATGIDQAQGAREFAMLLQGRSGAHNVFGSVLGFTGDKSQKLNAASGGDRLKMIEAELAKFEPSIAEFGKTFDALKSTMVDNAKSVLGKATLPLFDSVKGAMRDSNQWFDAHEETVMRFAGNIGASLKTAFETGRREIAWWTPAILTFAHNAYGEVVSIWDRVEPLVRRIGAIVQREIASPDLFKHLEKTASLYAAMKLGSFAAPAASSLMSGIGDAMGGSGAGGIAALGEAAAGAAIPVAVIGASVKGAFDILTDTSSLYHGFAVGQVKAMHEEFSRLGQTSGELAKSFQPITDLLGADLLFSLRLTTEGLGFLADEVGLLGKAVDVTAQAARGWAEWMGMVDKRRDPLPRDPNKLIHEWGRGDLTTLSATKKDTDGMKDRRGVVGGGGTSIQKVEIVVSSNQDPSRIARALTDRLADISRNPTSSRFTRNWGATRP